jgi:hypothetical protein
MNGHLFTPCKTQSLIVPTLCLGVELSRVEGGNGRWCGRQLRGVFWMRWIRRGMWGRCLAGWV